jgi:tol-pal system protein YbgF
MIWPIAHTKLGRLALGRTIAAGTAFWLCGVTADVGFAQQGPVRPQGAAKSSATKPPAEAAPTTAPSTDGGLRQRVEQLEEQLVDMQVAIGTLESLTKGAASSSSVYRGNSTPSAPAASGGGDGVRMDALEQQMRQISSQLEQLTQQMRQQGNRQASTAPVGNGGLAEVDPQVRPTARAQTATVGVPVGAPVGGQLPPTFGSTTVQPEPSSDAIGRVIAGGGIGTGGGAGDASPKQLYETAYGYLLAQDYGAAEAAFDEFLKRFPTDQLAGNAQYWLGETHFVRGQFKAAAGAFLKGYQTYTRSSKAPDSLLKLAMSLDRLGQKDAACSSFNELTAKFPNATAPVRSRADAERRRLACVSEHAWA